jgi:hypothetical protein
MTERFIDRQGNRQTGSLPRIWFLNWHADNLITAGRHGSGIAHYLLCC